MSDEKVVNALSPSWQTSTEIAKRAGYRMAQQVTWTLKRMVREGRVISRLKGDAKEYRWAEAGDEWVRNEFTKTPSEGTQAAMVAETIYLLCSGTDGQGVSNWEIANELHQFGGKGVSSVTSLMWKAGQVERRRVVTDGEVWIYHYRLTPQMVAYVEEGEVVAKPAETPVLVEPPKPEPVVKCAAAASESTTVLGGITDSSGVEMPWVSAILSSLAKHGDPTEVAITYGDRVVRLRQTVRIVEVE